MPKPPRNLKRLNDRVIEAMNTDGKRLEVMDEVARGLKLVTYKDGSKAWTCRPAVTNGKQKRVTIGNWCYRDGARDAACLTTTDARQRFADLMTDIRRGALSETPEKDPNELGCTFHAVAMRYLAYHQELIDKRRPGRKRPRTLEEERRVMNRDLFPAVVEGRILADMPLQEIRPKHLVAVLAKILARGSGMMRERTRAYLSNIFKWGMAEGIIEMNPVRAVARVVRETPRNRRFSHDEIKTLWNLWTGESPLSGAAWERQSLETPYLFMLGLTSLARREELRLMEWSRLKTEGPVPVWTVPTEIKMPDGKRLELIKNKIEHHVPLSRLSVEILEEHLRPLTGYSRWVFPSPAKEGWPRNPSGWQKAKKRYQKAAGLEDFRIHDLRSIAATLLAELQVPEEIIGACCNHKPRTITARVYIRQQARNFEPRAKALERLGEYLRQIAGGVTGGKILTFPN